MGTIYLMKKQKEKKKMEREINVVKIVADTKVEALEQAFNVMKEDLGGDESLTLKDLLYNSFIRSMPTKEILSIVHAELVRAQLEKGTATPGMLAGLLREMMDDK